MSEQLPRAPLPLDPEEEFAPDPPQAVATASEIDELRSLLVGPVADRVESLEERYDRRSADVEAVGDVLAEAVTLRNRRDDKLAGALRPTIEGAIQESVRRNRQIFVDAVYPALGPAIRKAIAATMRSMVQSLNQAIEQRYSVQGLKWRIEAMRTGRSFAEVVFLHTLVYRVEQVFLIHAETGLLLQHIVAEDVESPNADMVSGMLTAIQDFARDSFSMEGQASLENIRVGELTVWIEPGPSAVLAAVIRGEAPEALHEELQIALESIHGEMGEALADFQGDPAPFEVVRPALEQCIQSRQREAESKPNVTLWILILVVLGVIGFFVVRGVQKQQRWNELVEAISDEPGIVVTGMVDRDGQQLLRGLRDPLARDPAELVAESGIDPARVAFDLRTYSDLDPAFVLARARAVIEPNEEMRLELEGTRLVARGQATHGWLNRARLVAPAVPGITDIDLQDVVDTDLQALNESARQVASQQLRFAVGTSNLASGQEQTLRSLARGLESVFERARTTGGSFVLRIAGHTDATGDPEENIELSRERAESIADALRARGLRIPMETVGFGSEQPLREEVRDADREANRRVEFELRSLDATGSTH